MQRYHQGDESNPNYITARKAIENAFPNYRFQPIQNEGTPLWPEEISKILKEYVLKN